MTAIEKLKKAKEQCWTEEGGYRFTGCQKIEQLITEALAQLEAPQGEWTKGIRKQYKATFELIELGQPQDEIYVQLKEACTIIDRLEAEAKQAHKALNDLADGNLKLKQIIEAAISQHHRVRPNTVVDILIREYDALKG